MEEKRKTEEKVVTMFAFGQPISVICSRFNMNTEKVIEILKKSGIFNYENANIIA